MIRRTITLAVLTCLVAGACGCTSQAVWKSRGSLPVTVYLCTEDLDWLVPLSVEVPAADPAREAARLVVEWAGPGPLRTPFPAEWSVRSVSVDGATATVRVKAGDQPLDERRLKVAADSLVWTLTSIPDIKRVVLDMGATRAGPFSRPPFINRDGPPPWDCSMRLVLWFDYKGYLVPVTRFVPKTVYPHRTSVEQLIAGPPRTGKLSRTLPDGVGLLGLKVENGVCTVDLSGKARLRNTGGEAAESIVVQSIVLTLTEFLDVNSVEILIDGQKGSSLGGHIVLDRPLTRGLINPTAPGAN